MRGELPKGRHGARAKISIRQNIKTSDILRKRRKPSIQAAMTKHRIDKISKYQNITA